MEAKSLASDSVPAFVLIDEKSRRMRDYFSLSGQELPAGMGGKQTLIVNTNNALIKSLYAKKDKELSESVMEHLYELSLLSQKELDPKKLSGFIKRSSEVLTNLLS